MVTILCRYWLVECASLGAPSILSLYGIGHILLDNCHLIVHTYFHKCMVIMFVLLIIYFRFYACIILLNVLSHVLFLVFYLMALVTFELIIVIWWFNIESLCHSKDNLYNYRNLQLLHLNLFMILQYFLYSDSY